jgi:imidazolonepropionase-like amidohydrolase
MQIDIYEGDSLVVIIAVVDSDSAAKDLTGATVAAELRRTDGTGSDIAGTTVVTDAAGGRIGVTFAAGAITGPTAAGSLIPITYSLQCRVVLGSESQVVSSDTVRVLKAHI